MRAWLLWASTLVACGPTTAPRSDEPTAPSSPVTASATPVDAGAPDAAPTPRWVTTIVDVHGALASRAITEVPAATLAAVALGAAQAELGGGEAPASLAPDALAARLTALAARGGDDATATRAVAAMLRRLDDPHALVFSPEQAAAGAAMSAGQPSVTPGFRVHRAPDGAVVVDLVEAGGPAAAAGMKPGDVIVSVGGEPLARGRDLQRWLGAAPGTALPVVVQRAGKPVTLALTLQPFAPAPVSHRVDGAIGVVRLSALPRAGDPAHDVVAALRAALADLDRRKVKGLVLDLRGSLGGPPPAELVALFTHRPVLWRSVGTAGGPDEATRTGETWPTERPIAIVVDEETVSAAEIFTFALQDLDVAYVVGQPTAGGLTIPDVIPLPSGAIALYPARRVLGAVVEVAPADRKVTPTLVLPNRTAAQVIAGKDPQLAGALADVRRRLSRGAGARGTSRR